MGSPTNFRARRVVAVLLVVVSIFALSLYERHTSVTPTSEDKGVLSESNQPLARDILDNLEVKGRAPKTDYERSQFGSGWAEIEGCDMRNIILKRDLTQTEIADDSCIVLRGTLDDPYTGNSIAFVRGVSTSGDVQIDHVVALSDAWQKGAQEMDEFEREVFANDTLNLLAVDGPANQEKGDSDAASWLPPNKAYRCRYVARQIAVKAKYALWVTEAEKSAMIRVLNGCDRQVVPIEQ